MHSFGMRPAKGVEWIQTAAVASQFAHGRYTSRSSGDSAVRSAAYNGREAIAAQRTGEVFYFRHRDAPEHFQVTAVALAMSSPGSLKCLRPPNYRCDHSRPVSSAGLRFGSVPGTTGEKQENGEERTEGRAGRWSYSQSTCPKTNDYGHSSRLRP